MALEGQGAAITYNWIDPSSAEVRKPSLAGISSATGIAAQPLPTCMSPAPTLSHMQSITASLVDRGSAKGPSLESHATAVLKLTSSSPGAGRSQAGFGFIDLRADEVRQSYRPVAPVQQPPAAEETASYLLAAPEDEVCT